MKKVIKNLTYILGITLIFTLAKLIMYSLEWSERTFGSVSVSQIIFHLKTPLAGTDTEVVEGFISGYISDSIKYILMVFGLAVFVQILLVYSVKTNKLKDIKFLSITKKVILVCLSIYLFGVICYGVNALDVPTYITNIFVKSELYETCYVEPLEVVSEPQKKSNLIYIFCESMEDTFADKASGGGLNDSLIPNLTKLAMEYDNFGANGKLGGAKQLSNTEWTMAGMVAETAGIPLSIPIGDNSYGRVETFLPGITSLGDVLEKAGYNQMLMVGSDSTFAGTDHYYKQHGNYEIKDYYSAISSGFISSGYYEFWGIEDKKVFEWAKYQIKTLASKDKPFNFTMATMDTHIPDGYKCTNCKDEYDCPMKNAIKCSDAQIAEFVAWIMEQDFYKDTVIVIAGDHNTMYSDITSWYDGDIERQSYFTIINSKVSKALDAEREFTRVDIFPTVLASLGFEIKGDRCGLGTNLYSSAKTITEIIGFEKFNWMIGMSSEMYDEKFLLGN